MINFKKRNIPKHFFLKPYIQTKIGPKNVIYTLGLKLIKQCHRQKKIEKNVSKYHELFRGFHSWKEIGLWFIIFKPHFLKDFKKFKMTHTS